MKVWTNTSFIGFYKNVPTSAVVVAETAELAAALLNQKLADEQLYQALPVLPAQMGEVDTNTVGVIILQDGDL